MTGTYEPGQHLDTACYRVMVYSVSSRFRITSMSPNVEKILGHKPEALLGRHLQELGMFHPDDLDAAIAATVRVLCGEKILSTTCRLITRSGMEKPFEVSGVPLVLGNEVTGIIAVARDVTGQRHRVTVSGKPGRGAGTVPFRHSPAFLAAPGCQRWEERAAERPEIALSSERDEPETWRQDLEEMNIALKVLLKQRNNDRHDIEKNLIANIAVSILPSLDRLKNSGLRNDQMRWVSEIESCLKEIGSSFIRDFSSRHPDLSPSEIRVASLIKNGKSSKEIADFLHVSLNTVLFHRNNIRQKVGLKNSRNSLAIYLQTFDQSEP